MTKFFSEKIPPPRALPPSFYSMLIIIKITSKTDFPSASRRIAIFKGFGLFSILLIKTH